MPPRGRARLAAVAPAVGELEAAAVETLAAIPTEAQDAGCRALVLRYARTIDQASAIAADAASVPFNPDDAQALDRLRRRLDAHVVMAEVGPKLLAALEALNASPRARAAVGKPSGPAGKSKLSALREGA